MFSKFRVSIKTAAGWIVPPNKHPLLLSPQKQGPNQTVGDHLAIYDDTHAPDAGAESDGCVLATSLVLLCTLLGCGVLGNSHAPVTDAPDYGTSTRLYISDEAGHSLLECVEGPCRVIKRAESAEVL